MGTPFRPTAIEDLWKQYHSPSVPSYCTRLISKPYYSSAMLTLNVLHKTELLGLPGVTDRRVGPRTGVLPPATTVSAIEQAAGLHSTFAPASVSPCLPFKLFLQSLLICCSFAVQTANLDSRRLCAFRFTRVSVKVLGWRTGLLANPVS